MGLQKATRLQEPKESYIYWRHRLYHGSPDFAQAIWHASLDQDQANVKENYQLTDPSCSLPLYGQRPFREMPGGVIYLQQMIYPFLIL